MTTETPTPYNANFDELIASGDLKAGDQIRVERHPVYSGSERHAQYAESTRTIQATEQRTDYAGRATTWVLFKESKFWFDCHKNRLDGGNRKPLRYEVINW